MSSHESATHSQRITVEWDGAWWTISDEGGEFAKATEVHQALRYVGDLMSGPSTYLPTPVSVSVEQACDRCGRSASWSIGETYWFADNDLWNEVNGSPNGFMCPGCFTKAAAAKGIAIGWRAGRVGDIEVNEEELHND